VAISSTTIRLQWSDNSNNETSFDVNTSGGVTRSAPASSGSATGFDWTGLSPGTQTCFRVRAVNSVGASAWTPSASYFCTTTPASDTSPPSVSWRSPVGNGGTFAVSSGSVTLEASASDNVGVARVKFTRWDAVAGVWRDVATVSSAPWRTTIAVATLNSGYNQINVQAWDAAGNASTSPYIWLNVTSAPPTAPANVKNVNYGALNFRITWTDRSTNETGFQIYNGVETRTVGANTTTYLWAAQPNQYMCIAVRAYNSAGYSAWTGMWTCTTTPAGGPPAAPSGVVASGHSTSQIKITFTDNAANETAFQFWNGNETRTVTQDTPGRGATAVYYWGGLAPHTWMCVKVRSYNEWGASAWSPANTWACAWTLG
jgi:hypothetical protein